jgi:hypothetical protein
MTAEGKNVPAAGVEPRWLDVRTQGRVTAQPSIPDFPFKFVVNHWNSWGLTCIQEEAAWTQEDVRCAFAGEVDTLKIH